MLQIRYGHEEDYDSVVSLWEQSSLGRPTDDEWRAITIGRCARLLVATDGGAFVGAAVVAFDGWRGYVYHVAVIPAARHKGAGRALMAEAEQHVRREGGGRIFALVHEANTAGLALAAAAGYEPEGDLGLVKELTSRAVS